MADFFGLVISHNSCLTCYVFLKTSTASVHARALSAVEEPYNIFLTFKFVFEV